MSMPISAPEGGLGLIVSAIFWTEAVSRIQSPNMLFPARRELRFDLKEESLHNKEQIEELKDRLVRSMAEFDNFRKRSEREKSQMFDMVSQQDKVKLKEKYKNDIQTEVNENAEYCE